MKNVILFGLTQLAELLSFYITQSNNFKIAGFTVEKQYMNQTIFSGYPVVGFEEIETVYNPNEFSVLLCIGYHDMNRTRERLFSKVKEKGYKIENFCHPDSTILTKDLGEGTIILERSVIGPFVKMGTGNIFCPGSLIAHNTEIGNFNFFAISSSIAGNVSIGNNCFFGNNCTTKDGIIVNDYSLIGAGCYVSMDTDEYDVYVPRRGIKIENRKSIEIKL